MQTQVELYQHAQALPAALGTRILPGKEECAPSPAPDRGSTGADVSSTQGSRMDTPRAVPGPALLLWGTISANPNPSPCPGDALSVCPIPTPHQGAQSHPTLLSPKNWAGKSIKGVVFGVGWGSWRRFWGCRRELPVTARLHLPGHARVTPDALEVPCSNFNFIVSQSFSGSS